MMRLVAPSMILLIDLDNCIVDGVVEDWAEELIQICDTYTEFSPSRLGSHLILKGQKLVIRLGLIINRSKFTTLDAT